jgi:hypothetical protein
LTKRVRQMGLRAAARALRARAVRQMVDVLVRVLAHSRIANARANAMALTAVLAQDPVVLEDIITAGGLAPMVNLKHRGDTEWVRRTAGVVLAELGQLQVPPPSPPLGLAV